jgi:hypothetical protein
MIKARAIRLMPEIAKLLASDFDKLPAIAK